MIRFLRRAHLVPTLATMAIVLATLCSAALSQAAFAQVAGGSQAGGGTPPGPDSALLNAAPPAEPRQCIRRDADLVDSIENRLSAWVSVRQPTFANIKVIGNAIDPRKGTLSLTLMSNGLTLANSPEVGGTDTIVANVDAGMKLVPGRQYKITAKATVSNKKHILLRMSVDVGGICPLDGWLGR